MDRRESIEKFLEDVVKTVKGGLGKVITRTDQLTHMGRLKVDILSLKRDRDKKLAELGARAYELLIGQRSADIENDAQIRTCVETIEELDERIALKQDEYQRVAKMTTEQAGETPASPAGSAETVDPSRTVEEAAAGLEAEPSRSKK